MITHTSVDLEELDCQPQGVLQLSHCADKTLLNQLWYLQIALQLTFVCVCFPRSTRWPVKITAEGLGCWGNISSGSPWSSTRKRTKKPGRRVLDRQGSTLRTAFPFFFLLPFAFLLPQRWCEDKHGADCKMTLWSWAAQKAGTSLTHAWASWLLHTAGNILSMARPEAVCPAEHPTFCPTHTGPRTTSHQHSPLHRWEGRGLLVLKKWSPWTKAPSVTFLSSKLSSSSPSENFTPYWCERCNFLLSTSSITHH